MMHLFRLLFLTGFLLTCTLSVYAGSSDIRFTPNRGQIIDMAGRERPDILYTAEAPGMHIYFRRTGVSYVFIRTAHDSAEGSEDALSLQSISGLPAQNTTVAGYRMDVEFEGANLHAQVTSGDSIAGYSNYYFAHCADGITHVPAYRTITYHEVYPNIDLVFYATGRGMKYDFLVHPGGRVADIRLRYQGVESLRVTDAGELHIRTPLGELIEEKPVVYLEGSASIVTSHFQCDGDHMRFHVASYDTSRTLRIDPSLVWSTYFGGNSDDWTTNYFGRIHGQALAMDKSGNLLITGSTGSTNFPVSTGAFQTTLGAVANAVVVKLTGSGNRLWATYYGGSYGENGIGVAVDSSNSVFITGLTGGANVTAGTNNFPTTTGAFQASSPGNIDGYLVKFDSNGTRLWGSYYGGNSDERPYGIATDTAGNVVITMDAASNGLATTGAYRTTLAGSYDLLLAKFTGAGARLWATYCGPTNITSFNSNAACIDVAGNIYVTGMTPASTFPTTSGAFQTTGGGSFDAVVLKFAPSGAIRWSTYLGGSANDFGSGIMVDRDSNVYVSGFTASTDFPVTSGAVQSSNGGGLYDGFMASFTPGGAQRWATYYGGSSTDVFAGLVTDANRNISVTGYTASTNFPVTGDAYQSSRSGASDAVIVRFDSIGRRIWSTYLGGSNQELGAGIAVNRSGLIVAGTTVSNNFPTTTGAFQTSYGGNPYDLFISQFCALTPRVYTRTRDICTGDSTILTAPDGYTYLWSTGATSQSIAVRTPGSYWFRATEGTCVGYSDTVAVTIHALPSPTIAASGPARFCQGDSVRLDGGNYRSWRWNTSDTTRYLVARQSGSYSVTVTDQWGCSATSPAVNVTVDTLPVARITASSLKICPDDSVTLSGQPGYAAYQWSTGATTPQIRVGQAGVYWLRITNASGCISRPDSITLAMHQRPVVAISPVAPRYCPADSVTITAPAGYVAYRWSNGRTTQTIRVGDTMSYTVTVTDTNGCRGTSLPVKARPYTPPTVTVSPAGPVAICPGDSIRITAPVGMVSYRWNTGATTPAITVRTGGTYTVTATDTNGCRDSASFVLTVNQKPTPSISVSGARQQSPGIWAICEGEGATLSAGSFYEYRWSNGSANEKITVTQAGRYSVLVTAPSGCEGTSDTVEIVVQPRPDAGFTGPSALCVGTSGIYSVVKQPRVRYTWTVIGGTVTNGAGTAVLTVRWPAAGSGSVRLVAVDTVTGCSSRDSILVDVGNSLVPVVRASRSTTLCDGDSVVLDAGTGYRSYRWSTGATDRMIVVRTAGAYTVTVEDSSGCGGTSQPVTVRMQPPPQPVIAALGITSFCEGDSVVLDAGSGYADYIWSSGERTRTIIVRSAGDFTVTVTDTAGCTGTSAPVAVRPNVKPAPRISGPNSVCENAEKSYSVAAVAGSSYLWTTTLGGTITAGQGTPVVTVRWGASGTEQLDLHQTGSNGCEADATPYTVEIGTSLHPAVLPTGDVWLCEGDSVQLSAADGYDTYEWTTGERTQAIVVKSAGMYRVTVGDGGGCSGESDPVRVSFNARPVPVISPAVATLCEGDSVLLDAGDWLSYRWSTGAITRTIVVKSAGSYDVTVEDANGCRGTSVAATVTLAPPPAPPTITARGDTLVSSPALTYQWLRDSVAIADATDREYVITQPGSYRVRVTDASGCTAVSEAFTPDVAIATGTAVVGRYEAAPGERITIGLALARPRNLQRNGLHTFTAQVRFNRTMLVPAETDGPDLLDATHRTVTLTGTVDPIEGEDTLQLGSIEMIATLGNTIVTPLEILSLQWKEGVVRIDTVHGAFRLVGLCENGGTRLINTTGEMTLKPTRPNPTGGLTVVEYEVIETGPTRVYLTDMSGRQIVLVDAFLKAGRYMASFDAGAIASGTYLCVLQTETLRLTEPVVVTH